MALVVVRHVGFSFFLVYEAITPGFSLLLISCVFTYCTRLAFSAETTEANVEVFAGVFILSALSAALIIHVGTLGGSSRFLLYPLVVHRPLSEHDHIVQSKRCIPSFRAVVKECHLRRQRRRYPLLLYRWRIDQSRTLQP